MAKRGSDYFRKISAMREERKGRVPHSFAHFANEWF